MAAAHLRRRGFRLLGRNVRTRHGEIDLIAFDGSTLVFAEVKSRRSSAPRKGGPPDKEPLSLLGARQRARLRRLASAWLADPRNIRPTAHSIRFDAIGVVVDSSSKLLALQHVEGAW